MTFRFDAELLDRILPFHFRIGRDLAVEHLGPSLARIITVPVGSPVDQLASVVRPRGVVLTSWASIGHLSGRPVKLAITGGRSAARLRGDFVEIDTGALFAGSLIADDFEELSALGLTLGDFAHWDAAPDAAAMSRLRRRSLEDSQALLADLQAALDANEDLRAAEARLERDLQLAADLRIRIDARGVVCQFESSGAVRSIGLDERQALGQPLMSFSPELAAIVAEAATRPAGFSHPSCVVGLRGGLVFLEARTTLLNDGDVLLIARDVTDQQNEREVLRVAAEQDPLTGLPNRRVFWDALADSLMAAEPLWVLVVDVDDFKAINDRHGHHVGDAVLRQVAAQLSSSVRADDVAARLGGDEFAVLLRSASGAVAADVANRIVEGVRRPVHTADAVVAVTASVGGAPGRIGMTPDDVVAGADLAMYGSRRAHGAGRIGWFDERSDLSARRRRALTADLVRAVEHGELDVWFQPTIRLVDGYPAGVEALARWTHPEKGPISPEVFIELAERARIVRQLDLLIMEKAIGAYRDFAVEAGRGLRLGLNISPLSLSQDLAEHLAELVERYGVPQDRLVLEITETTLLRDLPSAAAILDELDRRGVQIALDDFGTGYSSLTHLHDLPIGIVKVDRSFVSAIETDPKARQLIVGAVGMADASGATIVAEGVETHAQARFLEEVGCRFAQGYLWSPPVPVSKLPGLLTALASVPQ